MKTDLEIAQAASLLPVTEIAAQLGLAEGEIDLYGHDKAKVHLEVLESRRGQPCGKLILCTAITPTPAGEGKTTINIGLSMGLARLGKRVVTTLREPSLGPAFGIKGGAAGGGYSQVVPMEDINLHFTGDLHAVTAAHNLCSAMLDNHLFQGNELEVEPDLIAWPRVMDMNDRSLRVVTIGQKGEGVERVTRFDITAASEVMAILCLATNLSDLKARLDRVFLGWSRFGKPVTAKDIRASGAMAALLKHAIMPNLVQTVENTPAIIHGGPFANIAHGCNSIQATKMGLKLADYCVTEAGFGADLGAEKFFDIKCRYADLVPACVVMVATVRALKMHGGVPLPELGEPDAAAVGRGMANLQKHCENMALFGMPVVVALNVFSGDTEEELQLVEREVAAWRLPVVRCHVWSRGGEGAVDLASEVVRCCAEAGPSRLSPLYELDLGLKEKIELISTKIYGADGVDFYSRAERALDRFSAHGYGGLPVCMAKTQASLSDDAMLRGRPKGWRLVVREARLSAGAGMVVPVCGKMTTMPGLPKRPGAARIDLVNGEIVGLF
ncbi:MAG: formate--tetrahydrofolate ligase [Gaiellales bacterium]|nr:formate--tetrahydrofolate ligase [Gaiellales bacterium]